MSVKCKNCGAILPESLICEYCEADNSPEFRAKFDDKGIGTIEYKGETVECYISEIEIDSVVPDSGRLVDGTIRRFAPITKRTFTIKEW